MKINMKTKKIVVIVTAILLIVLAVYQSPPMKEKRLDSIRGDIINQVYYSEGYDAAVETVLKFYPDDKDKAVGWIAGLILAEDNK